MCRAGTPQHAITLACERDNRVVALENSEMLLVGVKQVEVSDIEPPLKPREVRLLLNTERP